MGHGDVWVFHRGALGDSVLLWPRLRLRVRAGVRTVLVTDGAKAALAEREVGVVGVDAEQPRFNGLWREGASVEPERGARVVVEYLTGGAGDARGAVFVENLRRMFPGARVRSARPPRGGFEALFWWMAHPQSRVEHRENSHGPVVMHVGAGSEAKRWPMTRWAELREMVRQRWGSAVAPIAGEVERERLGGQERAEFEAMGGRWLENLGNLAESVRGARLFIGCDSGPAHLAAQLGVRTLVLFGPTAAEEWLPIGPSVRPVWTGETGTLARLRAEGVVTEAEVLLGMRGT